MYALPWSLIVILPSGHERHCHCDSCQCLTVLPAWSVSSDNGHFLTAMLMVAYWRKRNRWIIGKHYMFITFTDPWLIGMSEWLLPQEGQDCAIITYWYTGDDRQSLRYLAMRRKFSICLLIRIITVVRVEILKINYWWPRREPAYFTEIKDMTG